MLQVLKNTPQFNRCLWIFNKQLLLPGRGNGALCRAIEDLTTQFANRLDLVAKHKKYIGMIKWELPAGNQPTPTRAKTCVLKPGVFGYLVDQISHLVSTWVGDSLITALGAMPMHMALAAVIEAMFVVLGQPDLKHRQCSLAMDKWPNLIVAEH